MVRNIPDEIIHEILSPALRVPDKVFSAPSTRSSFVPSLESSSAILLVSKSWLRVATPLLYNVVILRSKGQAQALALVLRAHPYLGTFIKKLRVEGGYAVSMYKILQTAKNLTDLCLPLFVDKGDNACGLCRGLPLVDPTRVVLAYDPGFSIMPKAVRILVEALVECIPKWKNLAVFEMPHDLPWNLPKHNEAFSEPLKAAQNLRTLVVTSQERDLFLDGIPEYISTIAENPSLQEIRPKERPRKAVKPGFLQAVQDNARLRELIDLRLFDNSHQNPFVYPPQLAADPKAEDAIWDRVLFFLFREHNSPDSDSDDNFSDSDDEADFDPFTSRRLMPLLVCKRFLRLGIPYFYENPYIESSESIRIFARRLKAQPSLGLHVRRLFIYHYEHMEDLTYVLSRVPNLVELASFGVVLPWKVFKDLSIRCGASLDTFWGIAVHQSHKQIADPGIFSRFTQMQTFAWDSEARFNTTAIFVASDAFHNLKHLTIEKADCSFFTVLSRMQLPSLRSVALTAVTGDSHIFFQTHGGKIEELKVLLSAFYSDIFNQCPSTKVLTIFNSWHHEQGSLEEIFQRGNTHVFLERIVLELTPYQEEQLENFLSAFDRTPFPALQEIQHPLFAWDLSEAEMSKSPWVKWAETLQAQGINLVDRPGARWRPRRQFERRKVNRKSEK